MEAHTAVSAEFMVEVEGVEPDAVASLQTLEFASAILALVSAAARRDGEALTFTGLQVVNKCTAVIVQTSDAAVAGDATRTAVRLMSGADDDRGLASAVERARRARAALPQGYQARLKVGDIDEVVPTDVAPPARQPTSIEVLRVRAVRAGGSRPAIRFVGDDERAFTLDATEAQVREVGPHLYFEVEITAELVRAASGEIESGGLLDIQPVDPGEDVTLWRQWYQANAARFDEIDDLEAALGRD